MSTVLRSIWLALSLAVLISSCAVAQTTAQEFSAEQIAFFENEIRPTLAQHCYPCHGPEKQKAELRLDSIAGITQGGQSGPAMIPGDSKNSLLAQAIRYESLQMPPTGKLANHKIAAILKWIDDKAPVPIEFATPKDSGLANNEHATVKHRKSGEIAAEDRQHWAFGPIKNQPPPVPSHIRAGRKVSHPIDLWIEDRLNQEGVQSLDPAPTRVLVRRVFYTLTGLAPSNEELDEWTKRIGEAPDSEFNQQVYEQLLDDLLSRTAYAEHWARHWLDVVRFAQSNGYERDGYKPHAWRYRDYVIESFAKDKPYDRFVLEQLAGDELSDANPESRIATGFYRLGVWDDEPDDKRQAEFDDLDDSIVTIGSAFLGLSIGCARCHDHKFDPVPQEDYYRMLACIRNIRRYANPENHIDNASSFPLASDEQIRHKTSEYLARKSGNPQTVDQSPLDPSLGIAPWALSVREDPGPPPATHLLVRGNASTPGPAVEPGFLSVLSHSPASLDPSTEFKSSESPLNDLFPTSGRRLALARWISHPGNPLTARVLVNRLWHYHFGRGIVSTTADFGVAGSSPTHPELLDHLASVLIDNQWSIKHLHRYILTSDAYKRTSQFNPSIPEHLHASTKDPGNRFLWRQSLRRLEAESIRDRMLVASGELNTQTFGREMFPRLSAEVLAGQSKPGLGWETSPPLEQLRRSIYAIVKRSVRDPLLEWFDYSNTTSPLTERPQTTVAPQSLMLLNSRFTAQRAQAMAIRAAQNASDVEGQIRFIYRWTLQRDPTQEELRIALAAIDQASKDYLPLADQIHFRPDVPVSLFSGYRQQLAPEEFLIGPELKVAGVKTSERSLLPWTYYAGAWGGGYEGIDVVEKAFGPHAILKQREFLDGEVRCRMRIGRTTELATLVLRAKPDGNRFQGIVLRLDLAGQSIAIENLQGSKSIQSRLHHKLPVDQWIDLRFQVVGGKAQVWIGGVDSAQPLLELQFENNESTDAVKNRGSLGVACWGGTLSLDQAVLHVLDQDHPQRDKPIHVAYSQSFPDSDRAIDGWTAYAGQWSLQPDGVLRVESEQGPKLLWDKQLFREGLVSVEMKMGLQQANIGGLILCVSEPKIGADNWLGYEISLNMPKKTLLFGEHRNNWQPIAEIPIDIQPDRWHKLSAEIIPIADQQMQLKVYLDQQPEAVLVHTLANRLVGDQIGLRTWGSQIDYRNFELTTDSKQIAARWELPRADFGVDPEASGVSAAARISELRIDWSNRKALEMFCRTLLNVNEFLYID